jgi:hypothetical protein
VKTLKGVSLHCGENMHTLSSKGSAQARSTLTRLEVERGFCNNHSFLPKNPCLAVFGSRRSETEVLQRIGYYYSQLLKFSEGMKVCMMEFTQLYNTSMESLWKSQEKLSERCSLRRHS